MTFYKKTTLYFCCPSAPDYTQLCRKQGFYFQNPRCPNNLPHFCGKHSFVPQLCFCSNSCQLKTTVNCKHAHCALGGSLYVLLNNLCHSYEELVITWEGLGWADSQSARLSCYRTPWLDFFLCLFAAPPLSAQPSVNCQCAPKFTHQAQIDWLEVGNRKQTSSFHVFTSPDIFFIFKRVHHIQITIYI